MFLERVVLDIHFINVSKTCNTHQIKIEVQLSKCIHIHTHTCTTREKLSKICDEADTEFYKYFYMGRGQQGPEQGGGGVLPWGSRAKRCYRSPLK